MKIPTPEERMANIKKFAYSKTDKRDDEAGIDNAHRLIVALQLALGDTLDELESVPTWDNLRDRLVAKIEALKDKAAKYDAMQAKLDEHPYNPEAQRLCRFCRETHDVLIACPEYADKANLFGIEAKDSRQR